MAQIQSTIKIELENSKQSWLDLVRTAGMRRRVIIASLLGLFTQWSGNTLISYYLDDLLSLMGFTDPQFKGKLNVGITCWNFLNGMTIALLVGRFRRRAMYMTCTISLLCVWSSCSRTRNVQEASLCSNSGDEALDIVVGLRSRLWWCTYYSQKRAAGLWRN